MPPPKVKLHKSSGKVKTLVPLKPAEETSSENNTELELCWCIQKLELSLSSAKLSEKQAFDTEKALKILKGANQPLVKKRQIMRMTFGDYRSQMAAEEKQLSLAPRSIKFTAPKEQKSIGKSYFVKKSAFINSENNFKFHFKVNNDQENEVTTSVHENTVNNAETKFTPTDNSFRFNFHIDKEIAE
ncbi:UPF0488 protein CG14286 [Phlebotomus argentipes]|uniref:UPF0488 protein CG14286 n=1 Tax=Phlebotomus argentipes TaxID=94469 RepID=UPI0028933CD6|nr:UPF0488 protein CG14286 [Phlebotomus argentipes]